MYYKGPSTGELIGCLAVVAGFFIGLGVLLSFGLPKLWAVIKPWLHTITG